MNSYEFPALRMRYIPTPLFNVKAAQREDITFGYAPYSLEHIVNSAKKLCSAYWQSKKEEV